MLTLLVAIVVGTVLAIFATQNTEVVSLHWVGYSVANIPIYLAVLVPLSVGLLVAYMLHVARDLSQRLIISEEKDRIKNLKTQLAEVTKLAHKLELENIKLKTGKDGQKDENSL